MVRKLYLVLFLWLSTTVLFFLQDRYAVPNIDDWAYTLIVSSDDNNGYLTETPVRHRVCSLSDAFCSQQNDYLMTNGRFLVHVLVQYFCGTMKRDTFSWLNSTVFALFLIVALQFVKRKTDVWLLLSFVSALWLMLPYQGFVMMGPISLCINYLWTLVATLLVILLFRHITLHRMSKVLITASSLYAFVTGSLQESFSIGVGGTMLLFVVIRRHQVNRQAVVMTFAYIAGAMTCILSPANFQRAEAVGGIGLHLNAVMGLLSSPIFLLLAVCVTLEVYQGRAKEFLRKHFILLTALTLDLLFAVFIAYTARHQLTLVHVFSLIIVFSCWSSYVEKRKTLKRVMTVFLTVFAVFLYSQVFSMRKNWHNAYIAFEQRCRQCDDGTVNGGTFEAMADSLMYNRILNNYATIYTFIGWDYGKKMFSMYLTKGKSNSHIMNVLPRPQEELARQCEASAETRPLLFHLSDGYYIFRSDNRLPKDNVLLAGCRRSEFIYQSTDEGLFKADETFCYDGQHYYLFNNKPAIARVDSIHVVTD